MHGLGTRLGSLGFMLNKHLTPRVVIVNHQSQTNMRYVLYSLTRLSLLLLVKHTWYIVYTVNKVAYRKHHFTTSLLL